jgi:hypothetical protein
MSRIPKTAPLAPQLLGECDAVLHDADFVVVATEVAAPRTDH